jgi:hypothetical protein
MSDSNRISGDCRHRAGFGEPCEECRSVMVPRELLHRVLRDLSEFRELAECDFDETMEIESDIRSLLERSAK